MSLFFTLLIFIFAFVRKEVNTKLIKSLGNNLKKIRKDKKVSQETLSYDANIPLSQIGRIERGEINTTVDTIFKIAKALEIEPKDLFDF